MTFLEMFDLLANGLETENTSSTVTSAVVGAGYAVVLLLGETDYDFYDIFLFFCVTYIGWALVSALVVTTALF